MSRPLVDARIGPAGGAETSPHRPHETGGQTVGPFSRAAANRTALADPGKEAREGVLFFLVSSFHFRRGVYSESFRPHRNARKPAGEKLLVPQDPSVVA